MKSRLRTAVVVVVVVSAISPMTACYEMGDIKDIAACQAFAAAQTSYDKTVNAAIANPDDTGKQAEWMGSWLIFGQGIQAASVIPTTTSLKKELTDYSQVLQQAGPGASAPTQISIWKKGYATKIVKLCNELAAPIKITDLTVT
jgi:hypothetical protein